ncbi:MAG TPA: PEGA domain-containing protein [Polyangia bacterium]|nr:PEGA domain-containing protein [Polyangia bacterium]
MRAAAVALALAAAAPCARAVEPAPAPTEDPLRTRARALKDEGTRALDRGDAALALEKFRDAYHTYPSPNLRFNLALAMARLGRDADALAEFEGFLDTAMGAPEDARAYARAQAAALRGRLGCLAVRAAGAGVEISVDGRRAGVTPLQRSICVAPGAHDVTARKPGLAPFSSRVTIAAGAELALDVALAPAPGAPRSRHLAPIVVGVAAAAALAAGIGLRVSAQLDYDALASGAGRCAPNCAPDSWQGIRQREYAGDALLAVGATAAAADVVLWILDARAGRAAPRAALVPTGNGVALCGRF